MWSLGLIIGGIIGAIGGGFGAIVGATAGAAIGGSLSEKQKGPGDGRLAAREAAVRHLQEIGGSDE